MNHGDKFLLQCVAWVIGSILFLLGIGAWWEWYKSGKQVDIYARQGIQMTTWEVFIGLQPAEKVVQIKERKPE